MKKNETSAPVCCSDAPCDSGLRNQYFEGKRLTAESFRVEQSYHLDRRHLLNRAIHGWGVVYGYSVKPMRAERSRGDGEWGALQIGAGLALDECGRELLLAHPRTLSFEDVELFDKQGDWIKDQRPPKGSYESHEKQDTKEWQEARQEHPGHEERDKDRGCWLLSAHYAEQDVGALTINDPCNCERKEWDRVCETVRFSLRLIDCEKCCATFDCEMDCGCGTGKCCEQHHREPEHRRDAESRHDDDEPKYDESPESADELAKDRKHTPNPLHRGGCQCLCEHLMQLSQPRCDALKPIDDDCAHVRADLCHGVPLACVRLREGNCDNWMFDGKVEACGPRRTVKRNDALYDLIRGCDLTRISAIGWAGWHRDEEPISWDRFSKSFGIEAPQGQSVTRKYWVKFSRPVLASSVRADCFSMSVIASEEEGGWHVSRRVPIVAVKTRAAAGMPGYVTRARLIVDAGWLSDAINGRRTIFDEITAVEIEIRGDFIVDCNGQAIDANAIGLSPAPTGNGSPGGTFYSSFRVQARDAQSPSTGYDQTHRRQGD